MSRMGNKLIFTTLLLALTINLSWAQQLNFVKSLDNEQFANNLIPSLERNVSYIYATDSRNYPISYSIESDYFMVDGKTGQIFLIAYLNEELNSPFNYMYLNIKASTGKYSSKVTNRIQINDVNDKPPELLTNQRIFEVIEDNPYPVFLNYPNNSAVELHFHDPDPTNVDITLSCVNTEHSPNVCSYFNLTKNLAKSTSRDYFGSIQAVKKLVYLEKAVYQMVIVATDNLANSKQVVIELRVLPDFNKPPILSKDSYQFTVPEKQLKVIGKLQLDDRYDQSLRSKAVFKLVINPQELQTGLPFGSWNNDSSNVDFNLISNFITINSNNELQAINIVDRDSFQFSSLNGVLKLWVKVYFQTNPNNANFYMISIFFTDLNDNRPSLAFINDNVQIGQFTPLAISEQLKFQLTENEIGPIIFGVSNPINSVRRALIAYDLDLANNSTFTFVIREDLSSQKRLSTEALNYYFNFGPSFLNDMKCQFVTSRSSLNLFNVKQLDYESLDLEPVYDPVTKIGSKVISFLIGAKECDTNEVYSSLLVPVSVIVRDTNDNMPAFLQSTYFQQVDGTLNSNQRIMSFQVTDIDSGYYGVAGLQCSLLGTDSERFGVDSIQQAIYIRQGCSRSSCTNYFKSLYYFNLICRDDLGKGHAATATVIISFQSSIEASCFTVPVTRYNLLATGSLGIDIPSLTIKVNNPNIQSKIQYEIQNDLMKKLFVIDMFGNFKIIAAQLTKDDSPSKDGLFQIPVLVSSSSHCESLVTVSVTLSQALKQSSCPKISDNALCHFSINKTDFDSNRIRFCFYGTATPVYNINTPGSNANDFFSKIYYSLLPNSPDYLYINPYDGCVKISSAFNLDSSNLKYIQYSIGAFNPGYPDCIYTNQRSCLINILNPNVQELKCANDFSISQNNQTYQVQVSNADTNSKLLYRIVNEERFIRSTGQSQLFSLSPFLYKINAFTGLVEANFDHSNLPYSSILLNVEVSDTFQLSSPTKCFVEFRFNQQTGSTAPQIIGPPTRHEEICEDVPASSAVIRLHAFDATLTNQSLCFSASPNEYFRLQNNTCDSPQFSPANSNGVVVLKKSLVGYNSRSKVAPTFTATLFYCHQSSQLNAQSIQFTVLEVNKHAPQILKPLSSIVLYSNDKGNVMFSEPLQVLDQDQAPFNSFKCAVANDKRFAVTFDNLKRTVSLQLSEPTVALNEEYADLAIRCCDDEGFWRGNKCFSVAKCSLNAVRVSLANVRVPVYCGNREQFTVVSENAPLAAQVFGVRCFSNYTRQGITYTMLGRPMGEASFFSVDEKSGVVSVVQSLKYQRADQTLQVQCSNGQSSSVCNVDLRVVVDKPIMPIWVYPNPEWFGGCVNIGVDTEIGHFSLISQVQAYSPDLSKVEYWFVSNNRLRSYIYEFKIETLDSYGRIVLNENINRSTNLFREITLAATIKVGSEQKIVTTYQYICIKIAALSNDAPCFQKTPDGSQWPYQVQVRQNDDQCFTDQLIKVYNKNRLHNQVYYYLIPPADQIDYDLFSRFELDMIKGIVCYRNKQDNFNLIARLVNSNSSYMNPYVFNQVCVNLNVLATERLMSEAERAATVYDPDSCSFNYLKVCTIKPDDNTPPTFVENASAKSIEINMNNINPTQLSCLYRFEFAYSSNIGQTYKFTLESLTNPNDNNIFYVNETTHCLSVNQLTGPGAESYLRGLHKLKVTARDQFNQADTTYVFIYIVESCDQILRAYISSNIYTIQSKINTYLDQLGQLSSELFKKNITAINIGIYIDPSTVQSSTLFEASILEVALYDNENNLFLSDAQTETMLDSSLDTVNSQGLFINQIRSSCPSFSPRKSVLEKIGVALLAAILALLFFLLTIFLFFPLCYAFKLLKHRNNKIILKQSIVPIFEDNCPGVQQSNFPGIPLDNHSQMGNDVYAIQYDSNQNLDAIRDEISPYNNHFNQELMQAIRQRPLLREYGMERGGQANSSADESNDRKEDISDSEYKLEKNDN